MGPRGNGKHKTVFLLPKALQIDSPKNTIARR